MVVEGAAIAQWISLHLRSYGPGFESQSHIINAFSIYSLLYYIFNCVVKRMKMNKKRPGLAHILTVVVAELTEPLLPARIRTESIISHSITLLSRLTISTHQHI